MYHCRTIWWNNQLHTQLWSIWVKIMGKYLTSKNDYIPGALMYVWPPVHVTVLTIHTPDQSSGLLTQTMTHSSRSVTGMCLSEATFLNVSYTLAKIKNNYFKTHHRKFQLNPKESTWLFTGTSCCSWIPEHNKHALPCQSFVCNVSLKSHRKQVLQILRTSSWVLSIKGKTILR